ncbi:MAG TPA: DNA-3-methyladenine glycosylase [Cyclobacteriaceae bacterium]
MGLKLASSYYQGSNVKSIAKNLIGKVLQARIHNSITSGIIVETEAYSYKEKGCHAYNYLRTHRTDVMFSEGGVAYVYLCYGIHHLFNIVTNKIDKPEAVLIRALEPLEGQKMMLKRMKYDSISKITSGPGKLTKALGIDRRLNGKSLMGGEIWLEDRGIKFATNEIVSAKRIGIDYAGDDANLPWRFYVKGSEWISRP